MTILIAIYGAITGTIAIALQLHRFWRDRPRLRVELLPPSSMIVAGTPTHSTETYIRISITNLGREVIGVTHAHAWTFRDGEPKFLLFKESIEATPRALTAENPRTEYSARETDDFRTQDIVYVGVTDGAGRKYGAWTVAGRRKRQARRALKALGLKGLTPP